MSGFMISGWQVAKANITLMDAKGINGQPSRLKGRIVHVVAAVAWKCTHCAPHACMSLKGLYGFWINNNIGNVSTSIAHFIYTRTIIRPLPISSSDFPPSTCVQAATPANVFIIISPITSTGGYFFNIFFFTIIISPGNNKHIVTSIRTSFCERCSYDSIARTIVDVQRSPWRSVRLTHASNNTS